MQLNFHFFAQTHNTIVERCAQFAIYAAFYTSTDFRRFMQLHPHWHWYSGVISGTQLSIITLMHRLCADRQLPSVNRIGAFTFALFNGKPAFPAFRHIVCRDSIPMIITGRHTALHLPATLHGKCPGSSFDRQIGKLCFHVLCWHWCRKKYCHCHVSLNWFRRYVFMNSHKSA